MRDVLGYPRDAEAPGTSLSDVPAIEKRPVRILAEYHPVPERVSRGAGKRLNCDYSLTSRRAASLQDERFKYVWSSNGEEELYDVIADPGETVSVIDRHQAETARLKRELHTLLAAFERRRLDRPERSLDPATRDLLRSLGYVR
jgi:hypothetical protein